MAETYDFAAGHMPVIRDICEALGLERVRSLKLNIVVGEVVTVDVVRFVTVDEMKRLHEVIERYELTPTKDTTPLGEQFKRVEHP